LSQEGFPAVHVDSLHIGGCWCEEALSDEGLKRLWPEATKDFDSNIACDLGFLRTPLQSARDKVSLVVRRVESTIRILRVLATTAPASRANT
jgi:hypothetical protein